nr:hypothetical protein [Fusarium asiaticum narnavirus 1]
MASISAGLDSQKNPSTRTVDMAALRVRSTLAIEGGAPKDLEFRFMMNRILRSSPSKTATVMIRRPVRSQLKFSGVSRVTRDEIDLADKHLTDTYNVVSEELTRLRDAYKKRTQTDEGSTVDDLIPVVKTTKKGKVLKTLDDVQIEEETLKAISQREARMASLAKQLKLIGQTRQNAEQTLQARLDAGWKKYHLDSPDDTQEQYAISSYCNSIREEVFLPELTLPVHGINVSHNCEEFVHETWYPRLAEFFDRHGTDPFWYAPMEAIKDDKVQPLSQEAQSWLLRNLVSKKSLKISAMDKGQKEKVAWRWLIISHNSKHPTDRVPLDKKLSVKYERKASGQESARVAKPAVGFPNADKMKEFISSIVRDSHDRVLPNSNQSSGDTITLDRKQFFSYLDFTETTLKWMAKAYVVIDPEGGDYLPKNAKAPHNVTAAKTLSEWSKATSDLSDGKAITDLPNVEMVLKAQTKLTDQMVDEYINRSIAEEAAAPSREPSVHVSTVEDEPEAPESFDLDGKTWFRDDIDLLDIQDGQVVMTMCKFGELYRAIVPKGSPVNPTSTKAKGKAPVAPVLPLGNPKGESGSGKRESSQTLSGNPLNVKGVPKSKALTDAQRVALRKYFKLQDGLVDKDKWEKMTKEEKSKASEARSLPRWATAAVLKDSANLQKILEGKLTKDNVTAVLQGPTTSTGGKSQALEAWIKLRNDFRGTSLLRDPVSQKEKAFRKRFDLLKQEYGAQDCFPRLKERPDQQGRPSKKGGKPKSSSGGDVDFLSMIKLFGEVAKALRP